MASLSNHALESMGFKRLGPGESVTGTFRRVDVFSMQGITLDVPSLPFRADTINGVPFKMGLGASLNEVCRQLVEDDYIDDEERWKKDTQSSPPFLLLSFGPTAEHVGSGTHFKDSEDLIETFNSFAGAKKELLEQSEAVIPTLLTSLSLAFSSEGQLVRFLHRGAAVAGKSIDGKTINDWRLEFSATALVAIGMDNDKAEQITGSAINTAKTFDRDIAQFYYLGSNEKDPVKRFLQFFLCVERLVHSTFSTIEHKAAVSSLLLEHPNIEMSGQTLFAAHRDSWKDLRNRFIWCVMNKWTHLTDADVGQFVRLKSIRDDISHGKLLAPDKAAVKDIEALFLRILGRL